MSTAAKRTEVMDVDLDSLWAVITDYEGYADFVDGLAGTKIIERKGNEVFVEYHINMMGKDFKYVLCHKETPKKALKWHMVEGSFFKSNDGSWALKDLGDGQVEATYTVEVGFPLLVPKMITNALVVSSLPKMLEGFAARAKAHAKKAAKGKKPAKK